MVAGRLSTLTWYLSTVHHIQSSVTAIFIMNTKVSGLTGAPHTFECYCNLHHECESERFDGLTEDLRHWQSFANCLRGQLLSSCCVLSFVLIRKAVTFLLAFALKGCSNLPVFFHRLNLFGGDWYECTGTFCQVPYLLANSFLELFRIRCFECVPGEYVLIVLIILGYG